MELASEYPQLLLFLDLAGTFAFAVNGALMAVRTVRVDILGVISLATVTAIGGGILRDIIIGAVPPATFSDWRYLTIAASGGLLAFFLSRWLQRVEMPLLVLDAVGLGLFAVTGALKALAYGLGPGQSIILGALTAVGGGTIRDVLLREIPGVLHGELYATPAIIGAAVATLGQTLEHDVPAIAIAGAVVCFVIRMVAVWLHLHAPTPRKPPLPEPRSTPPPAP